MANDQLKRLQQSQAARRETLAQWRATRLTELELPSGMTVWVKDATMMDLMLTGKLPDGIVDFAEEAAKAGQASIDLKKVAQNAKGFKAMLDALVLECVVEPPIADQGDDDHLGIDEIGGDDKMAIFNWANREVDQLRPFREGENEPVEAVQPGNGLRPAAE
jgi:hypothetical protein